ncbi:uncharacterized protein LOC114758141 [Neltuma alba]|uniref:uncharacterized protein LOC114747133 n=1 Tax=Neltuma alba TaxID=207710 RepID=UPI0010A5567A|nr:uncharacterized protein LOC114747133 [Prosopis alba]XP_028802987.1 uncharacterized protein LOC114758141 [Prosopis alba]
MGSLMAGWDSPTLDPKSAKLERNRSLTKEEIDAFWKSRKQIEEEHLKAIASISENNKTSKYKESEKLSSVELARMKEFMGGDAGNSLERLIKKNGWWTKSNWAFLNEPPVMETSSNKYASQFHVATSASSNKMNPGDGISAA